MPIFCDVDESHTIDPDDIESKITERTKGIVIVHLYGVVCDMDRIMAIARKHNLYVIEDCAQAIGGKYKAKSVGTIGDVGCFSFAQSKHFTTGGEGGMVVTNDEDRGWEARSFRDHGYDVKASMNMLALEEKLPYIHNRVGFNFRSDRDAVHRRHQRAGASETWNLPRRFEYAKMYCEALGKLEGVKSLPVAFRERSRARYVPIILGPGRRKTTPAKFLEEIPQGISGAR
ncbi:MAG: DegT/DnrJ/EryC1/StrS family aminotransferase [Oscillospiraceae bacterium]